LLIRRQRQMCIRDRNTDADNDTARKLYDTYVLESGKRQYRVQLP
jgi:hypothetical protein